jgi:predicted  nucleic acid-binding Zn-ribbon protein
MAGDRQASKTMATGNKRASKAMTETENINYQEVDGAKRTRAHRSADAGAKTAERRLDAEREAASLRKQLQELRRQSTLMSAELHQLREAQGELDFQLLKARSELQQTRSELAASRERRKEMARVIARRDAELQVRYGELAALELHILRSSPTLLLSDSLRRLARAVRRRLTD